MSSKQFKTISLMHNSKKPAVDRWGATEPQERIDELTLETDRTKNYGVLTGSRSGYIVIDYDEYNVEDVSHRITFEQLKDSLGDDCLIVQTPSGGWHVYHEYEPDKMDSWKGICGIDGHIDIRTTGNYVVGPGSIVNDKEYLIKWQGDTIGPMPEGLFSMLDEYQSTKSSFESQGDIDFDETNSLLTQHGFTSIRWLGNGYNFSCDQMGRAGSVCPLCNHNHTSNHFRVAVHKNGDTTVRNHSQKCISRKLKGRILVFQDVPETYTHPPPEPESTNATDYDIMKEKHEKQMFFVEDSICYVIIKPDDTVDVLTLKKLRERFLHLSYEEHGKKKSFIETWIRDPEKRTYEKIDFIPEKCPSTTFNLWRGFNVEKIKPNKSDVSIAPFLALVNQLTDDTPDYFLKWVAQLFQHPGSKPITSPVFHGKQGCGKNSLTDFIGTRLMGKDLYQESGDCENKIFGRFSTVIEKCKLLMIDEMESSSGFKHASKLKALITNENHMVERKGMDTYSVQNLAGIIFNSNHSVPVKVEDSDRRFFVFKTQSKLDQDFFDMWRKWVNVEENQRAVYEYLLAIDLTKVNWIKDRPVTDAYREMKHHGVPSMVKWLDYLVTEDFPAKWSDNQNIKAAELYRNYQAFGHTIEKSPIQFGMSFKKMEVKGIEKVHTKTGACFKMCRETIFEWLKEHDYTLADTLPSPIEFDITTDADY
tara:strand:- start:157 stop:2265 length:2109 start_codon:yes stop_codon:yes gene_type:complete